MRFLESENFTKEEINHFCNSTSDAMVKALNQNSKLVKSNMEYLMELGVKNIHDIFSEYYEMFLLDHSNFINIFNKYDREDLIEKLEKNIAIVEYL